MRTLPDKLRAAKEGHHEKVRSIEGWADGAKGWFVDALLILIVDFDRCTYTATDAMRVKIG